MAQSTSAARLTPTPVYKSDNIKHLCRMEVPGGSQIVFQGKYCFIGHQHGPDGTTILDVSDPRAPKIVSKLMVEHPQTDALGLVQPVPGTGMKFLGLPLSFDGRRPAPRFAPPKLGEHTAEVLSALGYDAERQGELRARGAI